MKKNKLSLDRVLKDEETINPFQYFQLNSNISNQSINSNKTLLQSFKSLRSRQSSLRMESIIIDNVTAKTIPSIQHCLQKSETKGLEFSDNVPSVTEESLKVELGEGAHFKEAWDMSSRYSSMLNHMKSPTALTVSKKKKENSTASKLKNIIAQNKIKGLVRNFTNKIRRNNIYSQVVQNKQFEQQHSFFKFLDYQGIELNIQIQRIFNLILILSIFGYMYYITLILIFQIATKDLQIKISSFIAVIHLLDIIINSITMKKSGGQKLTIIKDIIKHYYYEHNMLLEIILLLSLFIELFLTEMALIILILVMVICKIPSLLDKLEKLENHFITTIYMEQYWSLLKIFLFNFCYAHILAILLTLMAKGNPQSSWIITKNIGGDPWYEIYIWAYYWAVNIMLTVGFGDIVPQTYEEALCLIFIETISCIVLAYNINNVGSLISNIRAQQVQKNKKYKVFRNLVNKNEITSDLTLKIQNFIEESNNIKKKFNIQQEHKFVDSLPKVYKKEYLKESNKSIFKNIFYFRGINQKAIQSLAEAIEIYVTHPEEIMLGSQDYLSLTILKRGSIGYFAKKAGSKLNNKIVEKICIDQNELPIIIGLQFILRRRPNYEIKSLEYSIMYHLGYQKLITHLQKSNRDYEYYCYLRDKSKYYLDQFEIIKCQNCDCKHTKFDCPKLHFMPIKQHTIFRTLFKEKVQKNKRNQEERVQFKKMNSLKEYSFIDSLFSGRNNVNSKKTKSFILNEFQNVDKIETKKTNTQYEDTFLGDDPYHLITNITNITTEAIKKEMISNKRKENEEDQMWDLSLDSMQNYKSYFPQSNPSNICINFLEMNSLCDFLNLQKNKNTCDIKESKVCKASSFRPTKGTQKSIEDNLLLRSQRQMMMTTKTIQL